MRQLNVLPRSWCLHGAIVTGGRYGPLVGTPWGEIVPDGIGAFGVVVAAAAAWLSQRASSGSIGASQIMAAIERDRRSTERVSRLSARLDNWDNGHESSRSASGWSHLSPWLRSGRSLGGSQHGLRRWPDVCQPRATHNRLICARRTTAIQRRCRVSEGHPYEHSG